MNVVWMVLEHVDYVNTDIIICCTVAVIYYKVQSELNCFSIATTENDYVELFGGKDVQLL